MHHKQFTALLSHSACQDPIIKYGIHLSQHVTVCIFCLLLYIGCKSVYATGNINWQ